MSTLAHTRADWIGSTRPAREQLADVVADLVRAKWRQHCVDYACSALFAWLLAATLAVLAMRQGLLGGSPLLVLSLLAALCAAPAVMFAWSRRPDTLQVAIEADLELNLKQRLSTAWEFAGASAGGNADASLAERLAAQAVRARLPARSRSALVFPLRLNTSGMLAPVAAIALALASVLEFDRAGTSAPLVVDQSVISEGVRLREYGQRMEGRARRDGLPRSAEASQQLQRLGNRMESASVSRGEALSRLRELDEELDAARRAALGEGTQSEIGPLQVDEMAGTRAPAGPDPRTLLQRLLDGQLRDGEAQALGSDPGALARAGISRETLDEALRSFDSGEQSALREILDKLARAAQQRDDARELDAARDQVTRAARNLDGSAGSGEQSDESSRGAAAREGGVGNDESDGGDEDISSGTPAPGTGAPGGRGDEAARAQMLRPAPREVDGGPVLQARGQPGDGGVFVSQARVLPRAGEIAIEPVELDARFAPELEAVLSKEHIPTHHKAFIRRYFLTLGEGAGSQESQR